MRRKLAEGEHRQKISITLSPRSKNMLKKLSKEMNMTPSRTVEFLMNSMEKQENMTFTNYVTELITEVMKIQKQK
jgi:macrodomain Ter protein organizer (MatP/YcbG family)